MANISVVNFPSNVRVPGVYVGIDSSQAGVGSVVQQTLIIGQPGTATVPLNQPFIASNLSTVATQCGGMTNSLYRMYNAYRQVDTFGTVWLLPVADNSGGVAQVQTVTFTGTVTQASTLSLYIGGQVVEVLCSVGDTPSIVAASTLAALALIPTVPVVATANSGVVTLTNVNKGTIAQNVSINAGGVTAGEATPPGLSVAIAQSTAGATDPLLTTALSNLGDTPFDYVIHPYSGSIQTGQLSTFFNDTAGRWSWSSELFGGAFGAFVGTFAQIDTFGSTLNDQHLSFLGVAGSVTPVDEIAARYGATCASSLRSDPAMPLTQILLGFAAPAPTNRFTVSERQTLLFDGISTFVTDQSGTTWLERACTTSQFAPSGAPSVAYLDVETPYTLMAVVRQVRIALQTKFARTKLVVDGTRITGGSNMVTSQTVLAEVIAQYQLLANEGLVQDVPTFVKTAYAQNVGGGEVRVFCPFNIAQQLRVIALNVQFKKS